MINALQPLTELPGVEFVMLVTHDGVPIAVPGRKPSMPGGVGDPDAEPGSLGRDDALAANSTSWLDEMRQAVGPLSWDEPRRVVLKGTRGTLVMQRMRSAVLLLVLAPGLAPEEVRLAMDGTVARIERSLRNMGKGRDDDQDRQPIRDSQPPAAIPSQQDAASLDDDLAPVTDSARRKNSSED